MTAKQSSTPDTTRTRNEKLSIMTQKQAKQAVLVRFDAAVLQSIRQHARRSMGAEICGVLLGHSDDDCTSVDACIAGEKAAQGASHVTFTQNTWEHIYSIKDKDFPEKKIVGWYHSHPGFGVFLSSHDTFIHENFFSVPQQVAWVFDPHSDEEGCFGWSQGKIRRLQRFEVSTKVPDTPPQPEPDIVAPHILTTPAVESQEQPRRNRLCSAWERIPVRKRCTLVLIALAILLGVIAAELILYFGIPVSLPLPKAEPVLEFIRRPFRSSAEEPAKEAANGTRQDAAAPDMAPVIEASVELHRGQQPEDQPDVVNVDMTSEEPPESDLPGPADEPPPDPASPDRHMGE